MRLASTRELAKSFGISHPTVIKALKYLVRDGLLTVKSGIGMFTNPEKVNLPEKLKIIGSLAFDGKAIYKRPEYWYLSNQFFISVLTESEKYQIQTDMLLEPLSEIASEISQKSFDGLLWFFPYAELAPQILELKKKGLPIVSVGTAIPGISSVAFDFEKDNYDVAKKMISEGRKKLAIVLKKNSNIETAAIRGIEKAMNESGLEFDPKLIFTPQMNEAEKFGEILSYVKPDGLIFNVHISPYLEALRKNLDIINGCRLYTGVFSVYRDMKYCGYTGIPDIGNAPEKAAANLIKQINDPENAEIIDLKIRMKIQ